MNAHDTTFDCNPCERCGTCEHEHGYEVVMRDWLDERGFIDAAATES